MKSDRDAAVLRAVDQLETALEIAKGRGANDASHFINRALTELLRLNKARRETAESLNEQNGVGG